MRNEKTLIDLTKQDAQERKEALYEAILIKLEDIEAALIALVNTK